MEPRAATKDTLSPTCSFTFFDCFSPTKPEDGAFGTLPRAGVEREMKIMYQQPHLVPPMKLTVFDELPSTPVPPPPSHMSQWVSQGRNLASRASQRASLSVRRKTNPRPQISGPMPRPAGDLPLRRARDWRPLELSIYMPDNRLSDLPEFDRLSFTEVGEIKFPPRAVLRAKSEEILQTQLPPVLDMRKPVSMFEERRRSHIRHDTSSTVISTSRPPSEYDALHSHPVSCATFPGLPPQVHMASRPENSITILTPMQEEFTPPATTATIEGLIMDFPKIDTVPKNRPSQDQVRSESEAPAPSPHVGGAPQGPSRHPQDSQNSAASYFHTNYQTQKRISQWLASRSHSSSISTVKSSSTSSSFAEHRRKRSQFYQLATNQAPPQPLQIARPQHQRSMTSSTVASTVDTAIMSFELNRSEVSMTTAPTELLQSRSGTIKSVGTGNVNGTSLKPIVNSIPDMPPQYVEFIDQSNNHGYQDLAVVKEIGGPLRSPGVGLAF